MGAPYTDTAVGEEYLLLRGHPDQGGLLVARELPRAPVIGELVPRRDSPGH